MLFKKNTLYWIKYLTLLLPLLTYNVWAQRQDTSLQVVYYLGEDALLNIDISHADLTISPSIDDSIRIHSEISIIPNNINTPFNGLELKATQQDSLSANIVLLIGSEIQPHNQAKAFCQIELPPNTNIKLNGRYTNIDLASPYGAFNAHTEYCKIHSVAFSPNKKHSISGSYTELYIDYIRSKIKLTGTNFKLISKDINILESNLSFSTINVGLIKQLNAQSYSDKYLISTIDSLTIKGEYSSLMVDYINTFFQSELSYGTLIIKGLNPYFSEVNLAHQYVNTQITYPANSAFNINADMRYCQLDLQGAKLKTINSPSNTLHKGHYGNKSENNGSFSIISSFGDVKMNKK